MTNESESGDPNYRSSSIGGAAGSTGYEYQATICAYLCVKLLAESSAENGVFGLTPLDHIVRIAAETGQAIDDLQFDTAEDRVCYVQAKHSLKLPEDNTINDLSKIEKHDFLAVCEQFVHQYRAKGRKEQECYLLITSAKSSKSITDRFRSQLEDFRGCPEFPLKGNELRRAEACIRIAYERVTATSLADVEAIEILKRWRVVELNLDVAGADLNSIIELLRTSVLVDPSQSSFAWDTLCRKSTHMISKRLHTNREILVSELEQKGIFVNSPSSLNADVNSLRSRSEEEILTLKEYTERQGPVKIDRQFPQYLPAGESYLLCAPPGGGKSTSILNLQGELSKSNPDVLLFRASNLAADSTAALQQKLGLGLSLFSVLKLWTSDQTGYVLIDDISKVSPDRLVPLFEAITLLRKNNSRWRFIGSIDADQLKYRADLVEPFGTGVQSKGYTNSAVNVSHFLIPELNDLELGQLKDSISDFTVFLEDYETKKFVRNPFNLCLFLLVRMDSGEFSGVLELDQYKVLEKFWQKKFCDHRTTVQAKREQIVRGLYESLVEKNEDVLVNSFDESSRAEIDYLLSAGLLVESQERVASDRTLSLQHALITCFAISTDEAFLERLDITSLKLIKYLPALLFHYCYLWQRDRRIFWNRMITDANDVDEKKFTILVDLALRLGKTPADIVPLEQMILESDASADSGVRKTARYLLLTGNHTLSTPLWEGVLMAIVQKYSGVLLIEVLVLCERIVHQSAYTKELVWKVLTLLISQLEHFPEAIPMVLDLLCDIFECRADDIVLYIQRLLSELDESVFLYVEDFRSTCKNLVKGGFLNEAGLLMKIAFSLNSSHQLGQLAHLFDEIEKRDPIKCIELASECFSCYSEGTIF
ncbi:MAG: hypothetical protein K2X29_02075, partial [Candidatus Obscuribacterales bacterium]|nr:hypothetical protein [Candidatus Obscuribacterales bacterium]